jgi:hypothetical protein
MTDSAFQQRTIQICRGRSDNETRGKENAMTMVTGLFKDKHDAECACRAVTELGYDRDDINVVTSSDEPQRYGPGPSPTVADSGHVQEQTAADHGVPAGSKLGGPMGGTLSTVAPPVAALGVLLIPGIALVAGPVALALAAAGAVSVAGGLVWLLAEWGIPGTRIKQYQDGIRAGGILLGVKARSETDARRIQQLWRDGGGEHVHS